MGLSKSDYLEQKLLRHALGISSFTMPTTVYLALFTTMPGEDGTGGTEISTSGTGYGRQAITWGTSSQSGGGEQVSNSADIAFSAALTDWATGASRILGIGLYDASTAGNLLYLGLLSGTEYPAFGENTGDLIHCPGGPPFANGDQVVLSNVSGMTGLTAGTLYYVVSVSGTNFQVSLTSGGSAVTFSADGTCNIALDKRAEVRTGYIFKVLATNLKVTEY